MELVVDWHVDTFGGPDPEHQLDELRPVFAGNRHPGTGGAERGGQSQRPVPQLIPRKALALAVIHRPAVTEAARSLGEESEQVQRATHFEFSAKSDRYFVELQPPSTTISCPLMKLAPSEHRNATVLAMSLTSPNRGYGVISTLILRNRSSSSRLATMGVRVTPGATALQRIPCGPYWQAMCRVSAVRPPFAAEYAPPRRPPTTAKVD